MEPPSENAALAAHTHCAVCFQHMCMRENKHKEQQQQKHIKKDNQIKTNGLKCHHHWDETYWVNMFPDCMSAMTSWSKRWLSYSEEYAVYHVQTIINSPASAALVTAYGPTPSYDMIQKDLIGQMCVIIIDVIRGAREAKKQHFTNKTAKPVEKIVVMTK